MANKYEAMFIFSTAMKDDVVEAALERIRGEFTKHGGTITETLMLGTRMFARPLHKKDAGIYVRITVSLDPKELGAVSAKLRLNEEIFRFQITKLDERKAAALAADAAVAAAYAKQSQAPIV